MDWPKESAERLYAHLLKDYRPRGTGFDELCSAPAKVRPHWVQFLRHLAEISPGEYARRWEITSRLIRENDVTFNPNENETGLAQAWSVESIPHLIAPDEWARIETGVRQRARLLNRMLCDLYGQQRLLREGHLPADLVFSHPGFLRPVHGMKVPGGTFLHIYAADLAKSADGRWYALADRTQAPSGAGYALENRISVSRTFPEVFQDYQIHRLVGFFQAFRETLNSLARHNRDNPRVVILSPGPFSENYFEHVSLARYLGYPIVEGGDLTTRDNCVYLKTLGGLQLVDVIMRNVNDSKCDPLELRYDSHIGIPGLVQAAHAGNVAVVNALGSGLVGSYGFMGYTGDVAEYFADETLQLPSVPTWWCGDSTSLEYVCANVKKLVVKAAQPHTRVAPSFGPTLTDAQAAAVVARIKENPAIYVGQEIVSLATTPTWANGRFEPRPMVLRVYAVATGDSYEVMPGGMTLISGSPQSQLVSPKRGGSSKDTWVISDGPIAATTVAQASQRILTLNRGAADQHPSRVADNIFWLGRYIERLDAGVRLIRAILSRAAGDHGLAATPELPSLVNVLADLDLVPTPPPIEDQRAWDHFLERELVAAIYDENRPGSLRWMLSALRRTAWIVRDRLSSDSWRIIHRLDADLGEHDPNVIVPLGDVYTYVSQLVLTIASFNGLAMESMTRGHTWRFLDIGRRVERSINILTLLKSTAVHKQEHEGAVLQALLEVADSAMTYRYRYLTTLQLDAVLDLLLTDESNPRSLAWQFANLSEHVQELPREKSTHRSTEQRIMLALTSRLGLLEVEGLAKPDEHGDHLELLRLIDEFLKELPVLSDSLTQTYFSHTEPVRQLGSEEES
ncbi:hypothetical protein GC173_01015 [bacterium]|nr:hypothetical protein [bacterium]